MTSMTPKCFKLSSVLLLCSIWSWTNFSCLYALDIEEACDSTRIPSSSNPIEYDPYKCDPTIGLFCNPYLSRCSCFVTDSEYSDYYDRCIAKVGHPCKATPAYTISCVENAECDDMTGFCRCRDKYVSNEHKTGCYSSATLSQVLNVNYLALIMTLTISSLILK